MKLAPRLTGGRSPTEGTGPVDELVDPAGRAHAREMLHLSGLDAARVLDRLHTGRCGLSDHEASTRLVAHGLNSLPAAAAPGLPRRLFTCARSPFVVLLILLDAVIAATGDLLGVTLITVMVAASLGLRLRHEQRFDHLLGSLDDLTRARVLVLRRSRPGSPAAPQPRRHNPRLLVPGDLIRLTAGDVAPADCLILSAEDLTVDQALLTGESMPVSKVALRPDGGATTGEPAGHGAVGALLGSPTVCLTGTAVASGQATAVVVKTGGATVLGATARAVDLPRRATASDLGLHRVTWTIIRLLGVLTPAVFVLTALSERETRWTSAAMFAVAVAVGLVPQMLPIVLAVAHGRGLSALAAVGIVVRRPAAVQDLGSMDVLCTDKTGTLTVGTPTLTRWVGPDGTPSREVLEYALLSSIFAADPGTALDTAILAHATPVDDALAHSRYDKSGDIAIDVGGRCATVLLDPVVGPRLAVTKGAATDVLARCTHVYGDGRRWPLTDRRRAAVELLCGRLWREGHRLLAVAYQTGDSTAALMAGGSLTLAGFLVFADPPKVGVADTLRRLTARGVRTVIITGDAAPAAAALGESIGLPAGRPVTGAQIDRLDEAALTARCAETVVFAEVDPVQKARIIRAMRGCGHTVGYLGDGINDVAALRAADVGICVAEGVGVARQAADAVLLADDLAGLERGLVEGRRATVNATKYLKATLSSNLGNVFSLLLAGAFLPFLPMLPIQLLSQNLCYDLVQLAVPFDRTDPEQLRLPHRWSPRDLIGFITCFGLLSSVFDIATFALLGQRLTATDPASQALFHTGWFVGNLLTQILAVQVIRTARVPILGSRASTAFALATVAGCGLALLVPYSPAAALLGLRPLPPAVLVALMVVGLGYLASLQGGKVLYRRATGRWL